MTNGRARMKNNEIEEKLKHFKEKRKEYEGLGENPKILKQLTVKDRLAMTEMASMMILDKFKNLEKVIKGLIILNILFVIYILTGTIMKLWQ